MTVPKFIRVFLGGLGEIGGPEETKQRMALDRQVFALAVLPTLAIGVLGVLRCFTLVPNSFICVFQQRH